jgi:hypothetical protein
MRKDPGEELLCGVARNITMRWDVFDTMEGWGTIRIRGTEASSGKGEE